MQQIAEWLQKLGMSEYAERFAENRIDFSVLPELTDQDLKELSVVLGDRRKILRAIAAFTRAAAEQPPSPSALPSAPKGIQPLGRPQRRSQQLGWRRLLRGLLPPLK